MEGNLTLATLMGCLQHHYEEKSSTDLCAQLTSISQMPNEGPVDFILRCIELREKLILTSKTSGEIEYFTSFFEYFRRVSRLFLRSVKKGLENNLILQEIRPVLRSQGVTNEDILSATQRVALMRGKEQRIYLKDPVK